jgi:4-hydroxythreonine-4-phosphate dehydrogenase
LEPIETEEVNKPIIAVTMGDPSGVGPELLVKALTSLDILDVCRPVIIGDPVALRRAADLLNQPLPLLTLEDPQGLSFEGAEESVVLLAPCTKLSMADIAYGRPTVTACRAAATWIETAARLAMDGTVDAICTCPIHKANLNRYGFEFPGHTEYFRHLTGAGEVVMMLAGTRLRVCLATIHHALSEVPPLISIPLICQTVRITARSLERYFGLKRPRVAVAALNPHGGEEGRFGREEIEVIGPAVRILRSEGIEVSGPYPADTLFHRAACGEFDTVVAMYHDQGLIPIKLLHFGEAVNVTLGLPIVRTSVDHGTAYDLAGTGKAGEGSLKAALRLAASMATNRKASADIWTQSSSGAPASTTSSP